ncbi:MAG: MFS transporter, partial [Acidobacteria bacterium]|nr:MFS transporter [Acidobacteriota bacterium]
IFWSLAAAGHALARGVTGFSIARFTLGIGESGNFPASIKTVAEWFPKNERALATGIFNSGTNIGVLVAAAMVPAITISYGWKWAFIVTGAIGFIWLAFWLALYHHPDQHPNLSAEERELIQSDPPDPEVRIPWLTLIRYPQTWAVAVGKFLTDPIWWVYLYWLPDFLNRNYSIDLKSVGLPLIAVYLISDVGSIAGGWLSSTLIKRGWTINRARKTAMLICAVSVTPIVFAGRASNVWVAVLLVGLAAAAHQGWSANIYTIASDMFPRRTIGSVIGFAGMCGAVGGMLIAKIVGYILEWTGSYVPIFIIAASAYLVALALVHTLSPRLEAARIGASSDPLP